MFVPLGTCWSEPKLAGRALSNSFAGDQVSDPTLLAQSNGVKSKGLGPLTLNGSRANASIGLDPNLLSSGE